MVYRRIFVAASIDPTPVTTASSGTNNPERLLLEVTWRLEPAASVSTSRNDHWRSRITRSFPRHLQAW